ncbi:P-loop containing nucleoside triphosphate hydrolase protein [Lophiostoma macrostomum CBS 122681]|uniref:P-loop containing nucleoside triphosphate hydrolase protein n=1 Tax=Lophiostoma macrostomum CBS 122681 TaxID=1314788 RepID=A0A6A6SHG2_9PLEO|nr:P-loop containing nucleoside triphosphate hydrolase protein [Lophiostoma macrostomum CBS 122681]
MQSVIQALASEGGLKRVLQLVKADVEDRTPIAQSDLLNGSMFPFFRVITYEKVLQSGLLEISVGTIYNTIFGPGGQYTLKLFTFIATKITEMSVENLQLSLTAFAKILDMNDNAQLILGLRPIAEAFATALDALNGGDDDSAAMSMRRMLRRAKKRLGMENEAHEESSPTKASSKARVQFEFSIDGPGLLSSNGPRHNNDLEDITEVRILPTFQEIIANRPPYLPPLDAIKCHVRGFGGLVDRHFRLYREDQVGPIRDAIKSELIGQKGPFTKGADPRRAKNTQRNLTRVNKYTTLQFERLFCDKWQGFVATITVEQPKEAQKTIMEKRKEWFRSKKRLQKDSLVCVLDSAGHAIFCTVANVKYEKKCIEESDSGDMDEQEEKEIPVFEDFVNDPQRAILTIAPIEDRDAATMADYFTKRKSSRNLMLLEFPRILLGAFKPTLEALQSLATGVEVPFADLLATEEVSSTASDIHPPEYTQQPGFRFDLSCLLDDGGSCTLSTKEDFDLKALDGSTLDEKQAEALVNILCRRVAICQGPPGTGKSFTASALMRVLLSTKNKSRKKKQKGPPVLVVTYTNHANDQTMENALDNGFSRIIRIGSRSKSERLQDLNLRVVSQGMQRTRTELDEGFSRSMALGADASFVREVLRDFGNGDEIENLKNHLQNNYPGYYEQFWGRDEDGFEMVAYDPGFVIKSWMAGKLGSGNVRQQKRNTTRLLDDEVSIRQMLPQERQALYAFWINEHHGSRRQMLRSALESWRKAKKEHDAARQETDLRCLEEADIIGVTTSGLARNTDLLKRLGIKVVLIEEAGEVLEAHTLTALLPSVEHLVLIGDHQQLKPQVNNFDLSSESRNGKQYCLDMSLFERLVSPPEGIPGARLPFTTLETQRRMHPSISDLIRQTLYPHLKDATKVIEHPEVIGMAKRLFWLDHEVPEVGAEKDELVATSKSNDYEVEMTARLVGHLLSQGEYQSKDIAVLTPYLGQLFKLRSRLDGQYEIVLDERDVEGLIKEGIIERAQSAGIRTEPSKVATLLQTLKLTTVDNFQGEEAKVVIISLVRSNKRNECGFLKTSNRINVLLSRAKYGMYIIGNSATSAHVPMWAKVVTLLNEKDNIGSKLALRCERHQDTLIEVSTPDDFTRLSPEGGCHLRCDRRLKCGHACIVKCHSDLRHNNIKCLEPCNRPKQGCDHICRKECGERCDLRCEEMLQGINLELSCGHVIPDLPCWQFQAKDTIECMVLVDRTVPGCQHTVKVKCHISVDSDGFRCTAMCGEALKCGHFCRMECSSCRNGLLKDWHATCTEICGRDFSNCRHTCKEFCHEGKPCGTCKLRCEVACSHSRCNQQCGEPCVPCAQAQCSSFCPHSRCTMPCAAPCDWIPCSKRCTKLLACGHQCPSLCGEICPSTAFCQQCGTDDNKNLMVDYEEMKTFQEMDLDHDPVLIPPCGHPTLMSNMDRWVDMSEVYDMNEDNTVKAIKATEPFSSKELKDLKGCPACRGSLRGVNRYGRLVRRVLLDESTKRFVTSAGTAYGPLTERLFTAQESLANDHGIPKNAMLPFRLTLSHRRDDQFSIICSTTQAWPRYEELKATRRTIQEYFRKVNKDETPFAHIYKLVETCRRRAGRIEDIDLRSPVSQVTFHIMAHAMLIRCDILLLSDVLHQTGKMKRPGPIATKVVVDLSQNRTECIRFIDEALKANDYERAVEGHIFYVRYCAIEIPYLTDAAKAQGLKDEGTAHINSAHALCENHNSAKVDSLVSEVKDAERALAGGSFMQTVSSEERRAVLAAMAKEFRGTGHWYTCVNGHPFSVGECGMPMQLARCPQCDSPIGGQHHRPTEGVARADDLDDELRRMNLGGRQPFM